MNCLRLLPLRLGLVGLVVTPAAAADQPNVLSPVMAVVEKYDEAAMEDVFDDGRFVSYDAVTLKVVSPDALANRTMRVFLEASSIAATSPLRQRGQHCRFNFDTNLLKDDQLYRGALEKLHCVSAAGAIVSVGLSPRMRPVDRGLLAVIDKELIRLGRSAEREQSSQLLRPSQQVAYYLLAGLANEGDPLEMLSKPQRQLFDVAQQGGRRAQLIAVCSDVRVALIDQTIQDKSGTYVFKTAVLYVLQEGEWVRKADGQTTAAL